jgi:hypothetical protein
MPRLLAPLGSAMTVTLTGVLTSPPALADAYEAPAAEGYRGTWYEITSGSGSAPNKYGGGMATYPQQHAPIAVHSADPAAGIDRTYFVFGGYNGDRGQTPNMVGYYDHTTGLLARPRTVLTRGQNDAHENPTLAVDDAGYLWMFSPGHGSRRKAIISRSAAPHAIDRWQRIAELSAGDSTFSYSQPHHIPGEGFVLLHTHYAPGTNRTLYWNTSDDGVAWDFDWDLTASNARPALAAMAKGQYQTSWRFGSTVATAFNMHPEGAPGAASDYRTNLYYLQTADRGQTWTTADGTSLTAADLPLTQTGNAALVVDYQSQNRNVYLKDVQQDAAGNPLLLYLTSGGPQPGPGNGPHTLHTARYDSDTDEWIVRDVFNVDHNYDYGSLYVSDDGDGETWRLIGALLDGAQAHATGGHIGLWESADRGQSWTLIQQLTDDDEVNHNYPRRPVDAGDGFYALWADGHAWQTSDSSLYFTTADGQVFRMPDTFAAGQEFAAPIPVPEPATGLPLAAGALAAGRRRNANGTERAG